MNVEEILSNSTSSKIDIYENSYMLVHSDYHGIGIPGGWPAGWTGIVQYISGYIYEGEIYRNTRHGYARAINPDGTYDIGHWNMGTFVCGDSFGADLKKTKSVPCKGKV